nr:GNAT family N-acetyltransferase [Variovorax ginsengisoli]
MPVVRMVEAQTPEHLDLARTIFRDYADALGVDLSFQNFDAELASLPGDYAPPRGTVLLALVDVDDAPSPAAADAAPRRLQLETQPGVWAEVAGCCALRPLDAADYPNAAEMKRLYVRPVFRGLGLGRQLAEAILDAARTSGYGCVLLDTLSDMESARALYEDLGFVEVPPYYHNPIAGSHYLKVAL